MVTVFSSGSTEINDLPIRRGKISQVGTQDEYTSWVQGPLASVKEEE